MQKDIDIRRGSSESCRIVCGRVGFLIIIVVLRIWAKYPWGLIFDQRNFIDVYIKILIFIKKAEFYHYNRPFFKKYIFYSKKYIILKFSGHYFNHSINYKYIYLTFNTHLYFVISIVPKNIVLCDSAYNTIMK